MHFPSASNKSSSMNELARHSDSLCTVQTRIGRAANHDDKKKYVRFKPSPKTRCNERASVNVVQSSLDSDTHTADHAKAFFTLNNGKPQLNTFPTLEESSILDSGPYFRICLKSNHVMSAFQLIKNQAEFAQIRTEGVKRIFAPKLNSLHRLTSQTP